MTAGMIDAALLQNSHFDFRIPFQKVTLNTAFGFGVLGSIIYLACTITKRGSKQQFHAGCFALTAFGGGYAITKLVEHNETATQNSHEKDIAEIKHPNTSTNRSSDKTTTTHQFQPAQQNNTESTGIEYLVSDIIRKDGFTLIFGDKGSGKSILGRQIAVCLSTGIFCPAFQEYTPARSQKVILLDAELTKADHVERGYRGNPNLTCYACDEFNYPTISDMLNDVERLVKEAGEDCTVILDCISSAQFGISLHSP